MKKEYIKAGEIVATHGIRGYVRVKPWCDSAEFLTRFKNIYFDENGINKKKVVSSSVHGNIVLMKLEEIDTLNQAETLKNTIVYIGRDECNLDENRYFITDIIGCEVIDAESGEKYGKVEDVEKYKANDVWNVKKGDKIFAFPAVGEFIEKVDIEKSVIYVKPIKGIFDYED